MAFLSSICLSSPTFAQLQCASAPVASSSATPICRLHLKSSNGARVCHAYTNKSKSLVIVKASADIDGTSVGSNDAAPEGEKPAVSVENLPLESKLQEKMDQKLRMKLAKKVRLRRNRLVRKRQLRKKGRWPPSKMKKLKNV